MIREIEIGNKTIRYELAYKKVKNINLRIKANGSISVSANKRVSEKVIDEFVSSNSSFIFRALEKYNTMSQKEKIQYYTESEVKEIIFSLCQEVYPYYGKRGVKYPEIKFRKMVSRWGSCHKQRGILTFNTNLMYAPTECIEYVVYHEFTHFLQPNHSDKFYSELAKVCPGWKQCRKKLKEIQIN